MSRIVSSLPGRIRVQDKSLRNKPRLDLLEAELRQLDGVASLDANAGAGSMVLHFDPGRIDGAALEALIDAAVDTALANPLIAGRAAQRSVKARANRYAKAGMLG